MNHEVYLASSIEGLKDNGRFQWLKKNLLTTANLKVDDSDKHLTIAFCNSMDENIIKEVTDCLVVRVPKKPLLFDSLRVLGGKVALVASKVPQEWRYEVNYIKEELERSYGCAVAHKNDFIPHISLCECKVEEMMTPLLVQLSKDLRPITFNFSQPRWIDRDNRCCNNPATSIRPLEKGSKDPSWGQFRIDVKDLPGREVATILNGGVFNDFYVAKFKGKFGLFRPEYVSNYYPVVKFYCGTNAPFVYDEVMISAGVPGYTTEDAFIAVKRDDRWSIFEVGFEQHPWMVVDNCESFNKAKDALESVIYKRLIHPWVSFEDYTEKEIWE